MIDLLKDQLGLFLLRVRKPNHFSLKYLSFSEWDLWEQLGFLIVSTERIKHLGTLFDTLLILLQALHHLTRYNAHPEGRWSFSPTLLLL